jgi:superfamily II DNA or RNA helicase
MPHALIDAGFLVKPSYYSITHADLKRVGTAANGDLDEGQLALACDRPELVEQIVRDWHSLASGRRTIAFAVNVAHSRHLAAAFSAAGVPAAHVDGTMSDKVASNAVVLQKLFKDRAFLINQL